MNASTPTTLLLLILAQGAAGATPPTDLYLQAFVNGVDKDYVVHVHQDATGLRMSPDDLITLGLARDALPPGPMILLSDIDGMSTEYLEAEQRLELTIPDRALAPQMLGAPSASESTPWSDTGLVFDYSLHVRGDQPANGDYPARTFVPTVSAGFGRTPLMQSEDFARSEDKVIRSASLGTDLRLFSPWGLIFNRGLTTVSSDEWEYVREDTFWTYSGIESMRTHVIGDFIGAPLTWTRALRLGGLRTARNFDVQPDLITFPVPALGGTALVPTTVDLLINGTRRFSAEAQPGPFLFSEPPPLTGAGEIAIVYRDALGRDVRITRPLYVDTRLLGDGLLDYDVELGFPRRDYGWRSFEYGEDPAAIGSLRYGVTDAVTFEAHTELNESLRNLGVGVLLGLSRFGVLSASLSRSTGAGSGLQASAGYQYIAQRWSIDLYDRRTRDDFRDLGSFEGIPVPQRLSRASMSLWVAGRHGLSLNYVDQQDTQISRSRIASFGYNANWFTGRVTTYLSLFRDYENADSDGAYFTVTVGFGRGGSAYGGASQYGAERTRMYGMGRPADYDLGGFGWNVAVEDGNDDYQRANARLEYRGKRVELAATASSTGSDERQVSSAFDAAGALVWMRGNLMATRTIDDGFALVSTRGLPGIPVLRENRLFGHTNRRGYLLVPDLPAYHTSRLSIDLLEAPVDVVAGEDRLLANPRGFSGVLVEFPLERMQGATIILVDEEQRPLPVGTRVTLIETSDVALVGYEGRVFFASLQADNHLSAETPDTVCRAEVKFDGAQSMQTLGPVVCRVLVAPVIRTSAVAALLWMLMTLTPGVAQAQLGCWVGMGSINFGNVNQIGAPAASVIGTMSLSCAGARQPYVRVCIALGTPEDTSADPRYLNGADRARLAYNIYKDPGHTQIWGNEFSLASSPRTVDLPMNYGTGNTTVPYFASLPVQDDARAGTYNVTFSYARDATVRAVEYSGSPPNCSSVMPVVSRFEFGVWANVVADCAVSASTLNFGVVDSLTRKPTRATSTISLRCTSGVNYKIALDEGTASGATVAERRMTRDGGAETLAYGLYTNAARRQIWGDGSSGSETESGTGSGTHRTENHTVYGEVELSRQDEPASGQYRDTITVTVTF